LRKLSQIVVPKLFDSDNVYVFQNSDRRLIFASPYECDFTLIGTAGEPFKGDPAIVPVSVGEIAYLCDAANRYFRARVDPSDVVRTVAGANAVFDRDGKGAARDGEMTFDAGRGKAPLPGGDFAWRRFDDEVDRAQARWRSLSERQARRLVAAYGTRIAAVLGDPQSRDDLGPRFGDELTGAEVRYLMTQEWARFPDDVLWRRSKLGLTMPAQDRDALAQFMATEMIGH